MKNIKEEILEREIVDAIAKADFFYEKYRNTFFFPNRFYEQHIYWATKAKELKKLIKKI